MKLAHKIEITVFSKPGEDEELIRRKLLSLLPFDAGKEKIEIKETKASGFNQKDIKIFEIELSKDRHINEFLKNLSDKLSAGQKELLLRQISSRLDSQLRFFIRLDKDRLLKNNDVLITDSGNCFHITISIAAFPARVENAVKVIKEICQKPPVTDRRHE